MSPSAISILHVFLTAPLKLITKLFSLSLVYNLSPLLFTLSAFFHVPPLPINNFSPPLLCNHGQQGGPQVLSHIRMMQDFITEQQQTKVIDIHCFIPMHIHTVLTGQQ